MLSVYLSGDKNFWVIFLVIFLRYLILAFGGIFDLLCHSEKEQYSLRKFSLSFPLIKTTPVRSSTRVITALVFAAIGYIVFVTPVSKYTQTYWNFQEHSVGYFIFSIVLMLFVHDAYFYWTHRWMHRKSIYRIVHRVHHLSTNPSPWAAMAFHPIESVIEGSVIALMAFLFPVHPLAIGIFLLFMMMYNVYGHLGYELYPKGFSYELAGQVDQYIG